MFKLLKASLLLLLSMIIVGCSSGDSSSGSDERELTKIVAIGDSIGDPAFLPNQPWPSRVQDATMVEVRNFSLESMTTGFFVGQIEQILDSEQPSHLMILLGTNDARQRMVTVAGQNLQFMVDQARRRGIIVVVGTVPVNFRNAGDSVRSAEISEKIRNLDGARIAEVRGAIGNNRGFLPDGIHPGSAGSQVIADLFTAQLQQ